MPLLKPFRGIQLNRSHLFSRSLVARWLMNEGAGNRIYDLSGNNNTGTFYGDTNWIPGKFGSCLGFDGTGDYVDAGSAASLNITSAITVGAWVKPSVFKVDVIAGRINTDGFNGWLVKRQSSGLIRVVLASSASSIIYQPAHIWTTNWVFVVFTYDGSNIRVYIDGSIIGTSTLYTEGMTYTSGRKLDIGRYPDFNGQYFIGIMDHLMIFNRALSASEIAHLYREPFCMFEQPISPAALFYEPPAEGLSIPVSMRYYRNRRVA